MSTIKLTITGLDELVQRYTTTKPDALKEGLRRGVTLASVYAMGEARRIVPVDTGHLRRNIWYRTENGGFRGVIGTNVEYAADVEFGTSRMRGRPYLIPSVVAPKNQNRIATLIRNEIIKAVSS